MIRSRDQLTDPEFRRRNGWVGAGPIHLLERGVVVDRHDRDDDRPYWLQVGDSGIELTRDEMTSLARDLAEYLGIDTGGQP